MRFCQRQSAGDAAAGVCGETLQKTAVPPHKDWYADTLNDPTAQQVVATSLQQQFSRPYAPDDIYLTSTVWRKLSHFRLMWSICSRSGSAAGGAAAGGV